MSENVATLDLDLELPLNTALGRRVGVFHQAVCVQLPDRAGLVERGGTRVPLVVYIGRRDYPLELELPPEVIEECCDGRTITYRHEALVLEPTLTEENEVVRDDDGQIVGTVKALYGLPSNAEPV